MQQQLQKEANESAYEPMKSLTVSVASHFGEVLCMMLMLMEDSMTKYPVQQEPPVPGRMRGVFPDVVLVSPLPEEPTQTGEKLNLQVLNCRRGECLDNL